MQDTATTGLPLDWDEWRKEWKAWKSAHEDDLRPIGAMRSAFPGKNFLADEVLGVWKVNGRAVELSEVVFPNLSERDAATGRLIEKRIRSIGITFDGVGTKGTGAVVGSFAELENALGLTA